MQLQNLLILVVSACNLVSARSIQGLEKRNPGDGSLFNGEIQWTGITSGDFVKTGADSNNLWYIQTWLDAFHNNFPNLDDRVGMYFTGGSNGQDDFNAMNNFNRLALGGKGKFYYDISKAEYFDQQGLERYDPNRQSNPLYWRAVYRSSKALASFSAGGTAYVYMKPNNCRTIFSPASQSPKDSDPNHGGQATNGEVWYYGELPVLMRNLRINKIIAFHLKDGASGTSIDDFTQDTQWDVNAPNAEPRTFVPDVAMDVSPIILPAEAGRPPMKRNFPPSHAKRDVSGVSGPTGSGITFSNSNVVSATGSSNSSVSGTLRSSPSSFLLSTSGSSAGSVSSGSGSSSPSTLLVSPSSVSGSGSLISSSSSAASSGPSGATSPTLTPSGSVTSQPNTATAVSSSSAAGSQTQPVTISASITDATTALQASSTANVLHSSVIILAPSIQSLIDKPTKDDAQDILNKIKDTESVEQNLAKEVGPPSSNQKKDCSKPKSIFDIFNAVSCIAGYLQKASDDIQKGIDDNFSELEDIKDDLSNIQDIEPALKYDPSDPDNTQDPTGSQTSEQPSQTSEPSSSSAGSTSSSQITSSASSSSSCTQLQTASACQAICQSITATGNSATQSCTTTCSTTYSGCSATGTISTITSSATAAACPLSLGGGPSISPSSDPAGPFTTAWWDYGISCAGPACSILLFPSTTGTESFTAPSMVSSSSPSPPGAPSSSTASPTPSSMLSGLQTTTSSSASILPSSSPSSTAPSSPSSTSPPSSSPAAPSSSIAPSSPAPPPSSTRPPPPTRTTCIDGTYNSFDECSNYCYQGQCQENAGQPSVTCACN